MSLPWHQRPPLNVRTKLDGMPTMLWREERLFLYHVARDLDQGRGEIVDLGAFLGGSAACFAAGLRDRDARAGRGDSRHAMRTDRA